MSIRKIVSKIFKSLLIVSVFVVAFFFGNAKTKAEDVNYSFPDKSSAPVFPEYYARDEENLCEAEKKLSNNNVAIYFRKCTNSSGTDFVQNKIVMNGVIVKNYTDGFGYLSLYSEKYTSGDVSYPSFNYLHSQTGEDGKNYGSNYESLYNFTYKLNGNTYWTIDPYLSGKSEWIIPSSVTVSGNNIIITGENSYASLTATWSLASTDKEPKVALKFTTKRDGAYSFGVFYSHKAKEQSDVKFIQVPFRYQEKNFPAYPTMVTEAFSTSGITQLTTTNKEKNKDITYGLVVDPTSQKYRWVYDEVRSYNDISVMSADEQSNYGLMITDSNSKVNPSIVTPIMGSNDSKMASGATYSFTYRPISNVSEVSNDSWYESYSDILTRVLKVKDYRNNYFASLTDTIFNIYDLLLDDNHSGWSTLAKGNYNIEGRNTVSNFDGLAYLQQYLLTEDDNMYKNRVIPSLEYILSRSNIFTYGKEDPEAGVNKRNEPYEGLGAEFGKGKYLASTYASAYLMTMGRTPVFGNSVSKYTRPNWLVSDSIQNPEEYLAKYKVTGNKDYLFGIGDDVTYKSYAVYHANNYITERINKANTTIINFDKFVNAAYYPNVYAMLAMYDEMLALYNTTKNQTYKKYADTYLAAAETAAKRMLATMWASAMPSLGSSTLNLNLNEIKTNILNAGHAHTYYKGDERDRLGISETTSGNEFKSGVSFKEGGSYPTWVTSRVGLGVEQATTFKHQENSNIYLSTWAGELMRLYAYTGNEMYQTFARNSIIGRYANYPGYYVNDFHTYSSWEDYPINGVDGTFIFYHHIPVMISMLQDFLFQQAFAWSDKNIDFPYTKSINLQTWFNTRHYGYQAGNVFDEKDMWLWLKEGLVTTNNQQIDWFAARKDGKVAFVYMNESDEDIEVTLTYNGTLGIDSSKKAYLYMVDKNATNGYSKSSTTINNGKHTITIKAKSLVTVVTEANVSKPEYAEGYVNYTYDTAEGMGDAAVGTNVLTDTQCVEGNMCDVNAYIIRVKNDSYHAYIYTDKKPYSVDSENGINSMTVRYTIDGGTPVSVTDRTYPFEVDVKVDDINSIFNYTVKFDIGKGTENPESSTQTLSLGLDSGNKLKSLSLTGCTLDPIFSSDEDWYKCVVPNKTTETTITAEANSSKALISGLGTRSLQPGVNSINIIVTAENGTISTYSVRLTRKYLDEITLAPKNTTYTGSPIEANKASTTSGLPATYTYYNGTTCSGTALSSAPINKGSYSVKATTPGNYNYEAGVSECVSHTITKGTPKISLIAINTSYTGSAIAANKATATLPNGDDKTLSYTYTYYSDSSCSTVISNIPINAGTYYVKATSAETGNLVSTSSSCTKHTITKATDLITLSKKETTYTGSPIAANVASTTSGLPVTYTYYNGTTCSGTALSGAPTNKGSYSVKAASAGNNNYSSNSVCVTHTITKGTPTINLSPSSETYTGSAIAANTATAKLPNGDDKILTYTYTYYSDSSCSTVLSSAPVNVGTYYVKATSEETGNLVSASSSCVGHTITRATDTVTLSKKETTYTGSSIAANVASATSNSSITYKFYSTTDCSGTVLSGAPINVGNYSVKATSAGNNNYSSGSTCVTHTITKGTPTISLSAKSAPYTGSAIAANNAIATNPNGNSVSLNYIYTYYTNDSCSSGATTVAPINAGTYYVKASSTATDNLISASSNCVSHTISKKVDTISVTAVTKTYTGSSFSASFSATSGTTVTPTYYSDAGCSTKTTTSNAVSAGGAPKTVGTYYAKATSAGNANYSAGSLSCSKAVTITQATNTLSVTAKSGLTYTGSSQALITESNVQGSVYYAVGTELTSNNYSTSGSTTIPSKTNAGTYKVYYYTPGNTNYKAASGSVSVVITKKADTVTLSAKSTTYTGSAITANTASATSSTTITYTYYSSVDCSGTALSGAPTNVGNYSVKATSAGNNNYFTDNVCVKHTITKGTPTVSLGAKSATYTGSAIVANTATATNPNGTSVSLSYTYKYYSDSSCSTVLSNTPINVGTYYVKATSDATDNLNSASSGCTKHTIANQADTVTLSAKNTTYTGDAITANTAISTSGSSITYTYYSSTNCSGTALSGAPINVGNYSVKATSAGNNNYSSGSICVTHTITKGTPTISLTEKTETYTGNKIVANEAIAANPNGTIIVLSYTYTYYTNDSCSSGATTTAPINAGTYYVKAVSTATDNLNSASSGCVKHIINKKADTVSITAVSKTYTGSSFSASFSATSGTTVTPIYYSDSSCSTKTTTSNAVSAGGAPKTVGTYYAKATSAGNANYSAGSLSCSKAVTITQATNTLSVTAKSGLTYTGSSQALIIESNVQGSVYYAVGTELTSSNYSSSGSTAIPSKTNAGTYKVYYYTPGNTNYKAASGNVSVTISTKSVAVSWGSTTSFTYNGSGQAPTASVSTGISAETMTVTRTTQTTVGSYTATASCSGVSGGQASCSNYTLTGITKAFTITQATNTLRVTAKTGLTYNGSSQSLVSASNAQGSVYYAVGTELTSSNYSSSGSTTVPSKTDAGTYKVYYYTPGNTNYSAKSGNVSVTIAKKEDTVTLTAKNTTYTGSVIAANTASATSGTAITYTYYSSVDCSGTALSGAPTNVGEYGVKATSAGNTNYSSSSTCVTHTITKGTPTISLASKTETYTGYPVAANAASATNPNGTSVTLKYTYKFYSDSSCNGSFTTTGPTNAGTYYVKAISTATDNLDSASSSCVKHIINKKDDIVTLTAKSVTYTGSQIAANTATSTSGTTITYTYYSSSDCSGTALSGAPINVGNYSVKATSIGNNNYSSASTCVTHTVTKKTDSINISSKNTTYTGSQIPANIATSASGTSLTYTYYTGTICGGTALSEAPTNVGEYSVKVVSEGNNNYSSGSTCIKHTITKGTPIINLVAKTSSYTGSPIPANTATATNPNGSEVTLTYTYKYYSNSSCTSGVTTIIPSAVGTYYVKAISNETDNLNSASSNCTKHTITSNNNPILKSISVIGYNLTKIDDNHYTLTVENSVESVEVNATTTGTVANMTGTGLKSLVVGENIVKVVITELDGTVSIYEIIITRKASNDATLKSLSVNGYNLNPSFNANTITYNLTVSYSVTNLIVNATVNNSEASFVVSGNTNFKVGNNPISVVVTAGDKTTKTYTINVTRLKDADNTLKSLTVTNHTISPVFDKDVLLYTLTVDNNVTSLEVKAITNSDVASYEVSGNTNLKVGENQILVKVKAQNDSVRTYTITVIRKASSDATLKSLSVSGYNINPVFNSSEIAYSVTVPYSITSLEVNAEVNNSEASFTVNGNKDFKVGDNNITIVVTAGNGTKKTYTITVVRERDTINTLSSLSLTGCTLNPTFGSEITSYRCTVNNDVDSTIVSALATSNVATITGLGTKALNVGENQIIVTVTSQSGTIKAYTVVVTRNNFIGDNYLFGDVNNDGKFSVTDIVTLRRYLANITTDINKNNSDANKDGNVTLTDLIVFRKKLAGLE